MNFHSTRKKRTLSSLRDAALTVIMGGGTIGERPHLRQSA